VLLSAFFTLALFTDFLLFEVAFCLGFSLLEVFFGGCWTGKERKYTDEKIHCYLSTFLMPVNIREN
jgi:hypothetical protein